jgi:hypothetical protein
MPVMVIGRIPGDPDALLASLRDTVNPVMSRVAMRNGALSHMVARDDHGLVYVDVWRTAEGWRTAMANPDVQRSLEAAAIRFADDPEVHEVLEILP